MPFQSEKQRRYLWANEPEIAREWTDKYGSRVRKDNGGILQNIQSYAMPAWNLAKGIYGNQNPTITDSMRQDLIERAEAKGGDTGTLSYEDYGLNTSTPGGRFAGGITDIINDPHAFANAASLGRVSFDRDPETGEYFFGDTKYDFNVGDDETGLGANILRGINEGGLKNVVKKGWDAIKNEFSGSAQAAFPHMMRFKKRKDRIMSQAKKQAAMQQRIRQHEAAQAAKQRAINRLGPNNPLIGKIDHTGGGGHGSITRAPGSKGPKGTPTHRTRDDLMAQGGIAGLWQR